MRAVRRSSVSLLLGMLLILACSKPEAEGNGTSSAVTVADTGATLNPPAELSMDVQHRTMDSVQVNYASLLTALSEKSGAGVAAAAANLAGLADRIPVFMIHKAGVAPDSLTPWSRMLKGQALRTAELARAGDFEAAQEVSTRMTGTCNTCHEMYRDEPAPHEHAEGEEHDHGA